jgi:hypothetical protein
MDREDSGSKVSGWVDGQIYGSVSQPGFHRISSGVPREIVEYYVDNITDLYIKFS